MIRPKLANRPAGLLFLWWALGVNGAALPEPPPPRARAEVEAVLAKAPRAPAAGKLRPLNVVLVAFQKDHGPEEHDYPKWQERWAVLLGGKRAESPGIQVNLFGPPPARSDSSLTAGAPKVSVTTASAWPGAEQFKAADLVVMFCYRSGGAKRCWGDQQIRELDEFLKRGGGFVPIHSATYCGGDMRQSDAARELPLTGLAFDKSIMVRHGPVTMRLAMPKHPICLGLPRQIEFFDEPYWPAAGDAAKVEVLGTTTEIVARGETETAPQPLFWTYRRVKGRVFGCVMGHYNWTFDDPYFRLLLLRGMAWAAGGSPYRFDALALRGARVR
jgi:type 1 glutamine amidotransferase